MSRIKRYLLLVTSLGVAVVALVGSGGGAMAARTHANAAKSGPLIAISNLGAGCGAFCVQLQTSTVNAFKAAGFNNFLFLDGNFDANKMVANAGVVASRHAAVYIDQDGGITNYKATIQKMGNAHIPIVFLFGGPPAGPSPTSTVAWYAASHAYSGVLAGNFISDYVKKNWGGKIDGLFAEWLSSWPQENKEAIENMVPIVDKKLGLNYTMKSGMTLYDGQGNSTPLQAGVTAFLNAHPGAHHLVFYTATSDADAASVETALQQAGRVKDAMIISIGGSAEGVALLCNKNSAMKGDINYAPGTWGPGIVSLAQHMMAGDMVPKINNPAIEVVTPATASKYFKC